MSPTAPSDNVLHLTAEMGRPSFIKIRVARREGGEITDVRVGGECRFMGEGYLEVEE